jgi:uncharacterized membrane protein YbhN (UPF0104 family)
MAPVCRVGARVSPSTEQDMAGPRVVSWKRIVRWAIGLACLVYVVRYFLVNWEDVSSTFRLDLPVVAGIFGILLFHLLVHAVRFHVVITKCSGRRVPFLQWLRIFVHARFLNNVLPQAGNAYRIVTLKSTYGITYTRYITSHVAAFWMEVIVNFALAGAVVAAADPALTVGDVPLVPMLLGAAAAVFAGPFVVELVSRRFQFRVQAMAWAHQKMSELLRVTRESVRDVPYLLRVLGLVLVQFVDMTIVFYLTFLSLGKNVDLATLAAFYALYKLSAYFIIAPGGNLGVREVLYGLLGAQMGIGTTEGMLASVVIRVLSFISLVLVGLSFGGAGLLRKGGAPGTNGGRTDGP